MSDRVDRCRTKDINPASSVAFTLMPLIRTTSLSSIAEFMLRLPLVSLSNSPKRTHNLHLLQYQHGIQAIVRPLEARRNAPFFSTDACKRTPSCLQEEMERILLLLLLLLFIRVVMQFIEKDPEPQTQAKILVTPVTRGVKIRQIVTWNNCNQYGMRHSAN
jgi:hypothetical protein